MKKLVLVTMVAVLGLMILIPLSGFCDNPWHNQYRPQYVAVRDHGSHDFRPAPVHYNYHRDVRYVGHRDDRSGQVAAVAIGGILVGALIGSVIAQGR